MRHIFKCISCNKYTMKEICGCGNKGLIARPLKYTPDDRFVRYRREAKLTEYAARGLL